MSNQAIITETRRSPVVVVMGHVDHGKTSLLDYIRKTNVTAREAGGITQSIGAYEIIHNGRKITFIDTPGHEAFSKMRSRGAQVADLAILVVAADDGVKPQTKEAINTLKNTKTPFIVAINKIDKNNADIERVKNDLLQNEVLLEGYGGDTSFQQISAKTGEGVNELLDLLVLASDLEDLAYDLEAPASGIVIESKLDRRRGNEVMAVLKSGKLKRGDEITTPSAGGKIKVLENFLGEQVEEISPSSPALILGFEKLPAVGEEFKPGKFEGSGERKITRPGERKEKENGKLSLRIILKADVAGSLEAISDILKAMSQEEVAVEIMEARVGDVGDGDVKSAIANGAVIFGFHVRIEKGAQVLAQANGIKIITGDIIYELVKLAEEEINNLKSPKPTGMLEVLAVFNQKTHKQLIGGKVTYGLVKVKGVYEVRRGEEVVGTGRIMSLKQHKQEITQAEINKECGVLFDSSVKVEVDDVLAAKAGA